MPKLIYANLINNSYYFEILESRTIRGGTKYQKCLLISNFRSERWSKINKGIISEMKRCKIRIAKIVWFKNKVRIKEIVLCKKR